MLKVHDRNVEIESDDRASESHSLINIYFDVIRNNSHSSEANKLCNHIFKLNNCVACHTRCETKKSITWFIFEKYLKGLITRSLTYKNCVFLGANAVTGQL